MENEISKNIKRLKENTYVLKLGDIKVEIEYSKNSKKFNECMLNILKERGK